MYAHRRARFSYRVRGQRWRRQRRFKVRQYPRPKRRRAAIATSMGATGGSCSRWPEYRRSLHVGLVWIPTIASIVLSFTDWKGIRFSDINWVGFKNYEQIFTVFDRNFFQALINNSVLLVIPLIRTFRARHAPGLSPRSGMSAAPGSTRESSLRRSCFHSPSSVSCGKASSTRPRTGSLPNLRRRQGN